MIALFRLGGWILPVYWGHCWDFFMSSNEVIETGNLDHPSQIPTYFMKMCYDRTLTEVSVSVIHVLCHLPSPPMAPFFPEKVPHWAAQADLQLLGLNDPPVWPPELWDRTSVYHSSWVHTLLELCFHSPYMPSFLEGFTASVVPTPKETSSISLSFTFFFFPRSSKTKIFGLCLQRRPVVASLAIYFYDK